MIHARKRGDAAGWDPTEYGGLTDAACAAYGGLEEVAVPDFRERRCRMYFGGGGLLIVLVIIALVLGWTLIGIILITLGVLAGYSAFYGSRRTPSGDPATHPTAAPSGRRPFLSS